MLYPITIQNTFFSSTTGIIYIFNFKTGNKTYVYCLIAIQYAESLLLYHIGKITLLNKLYNSISIIIVISSKTRLSFPPKKLRADLGDVVVIILGEASLSLT